MKFFAHPDLDQFKRDELDGWFAKVVVDKPKESRSGMSNPRPPKALPQKLIARIERSVLCVPRIYGPSFGSPIMGFCQSDPTSISVAHSRYQTAWSRYLVLCTSTSRYNASFGQLRVSRARLPEAIQEDVHVPQAPD